MARQIIKKGLVLKSVTFTLIVAFVLSSAPVGVYASLGNTYKLRTQSRIMTDGGTTLKNDLKNQADGGMQISGYVNILAENFIVGKEKDVGRVIRLEELIKKKLGVILGHSATREQFINELATQKKITLINSGVDAKEADEISKAEAVDRFNEIIDHRTHAALDMGLKGLLVECIGGSIEEIEKQLEGRYKNIKKKELLNSELVFFFANEPPGLIGKIAEVKDKKADVAAETESIREVHQFIYDWFEKKYDRETARSIKLLYGASVDGNNVDRIMSVKSTRPGMEGYPLVHGILFASSGKKVDGFLAVAEGIDRAAEKDGREYFCIVNLKSFKNEDKTPPIEYISEIYKAILEGRIEPSRVILAIADQDATLERWQSALAKAEKDYLRKEVVLESLYPAEGKTEVVGAGFTKEILVSRIKAAKDILNSKLEKRFGDKTREGDVYFLLKKNNRYFALAKENSIDQTLMTAPLLDLTDSKTREEYYTTLLEYVSIVTTQAGKGLEFIPTAGDELKSFLTQKTSAAKTRPNNPNVIEESFFSGEIVGTKRWQGDGILEEPFFQFEYNIASAEEGIRPALLTFKQSGNPQAGGWSAIIQPKYTHLVFGFGTIGSQVAQNSRELGFNVVAINRSPNEKAAFAQDSGFPLYLLDAKNAEAFNKEKIKTEGPLEDLAKIGVDLITDATDGETKDPETGKDITVADYNTKYIYNKYFPNAKLMYEGAEDPEIADEFFDVGTLSLLGISFSEIMKNVKSLFFPSCNTTGYGFVLDRVAFNSKSESLVVRGSAHRRAHDPWQKGKLASDSTDFVADYHHKEDYLVGRKKFASIRDAFKKGPSGEPRLTTDASTTHLTKFHIIEIWIEGLDKAGNPLTADSVKRFLSDEPRLALVDFKKDKFSVAAFGDVLQNKMGVVHPYAPIIQVLDLPSGDVKVVMAVPQESIVIPNNMNGIHALLGLYEREASVRLVNDVMGLTKISRKIESSKPLKSARVKPAIAAPEEPELPIDVLTTDDINLEGLAVLIRGDGNSPVKDGIVSELTPKLVDDAMAIKELRDKYKGKIKIIYLTHQGRLGDEDYLANLKQHAEIISRLTGIEVSYVDDVFGDEAVNAIKAMEDGDVIVLANPRAWEEEVAKLTPEEHAKSPLIRKVQSAVDVVILNAASVAHRSHLTVVGFGDVPNIAGPAITRDIIEYKRFYEELMKGNVVGVFGGKKIDDYLGLMRKGLEKGIFDKILAEGVLGNICLKVLGYNLGQATEDVLHKEFGGKLPDIIEKVKELLEKYPDNIIVPEDVTFINKDEKREEVVLEERHKTEPITEFVIADIGTRTANDYVKYIIKAERIFFKGPAGDYKKPQLITGSKIVLEGIAESKAKKLRSGSDSGVVAKRFDVSFDINSEGGGAMFKFLEKGTLPALEVLKDSARKVREVTSKLGATADEFIKNFDKPGRIINSLLSRENLREFMDTVSKLLETGELEKKNYALVATSDFLKEPGAIHAIKELTRFGDVIKIVLYGEDAENLEVLIGAKDIITAKNLDELRERLANHIIDLNNVFLLGGSVKDKELLAGMAKELNPEIRQIVSGDIPALAIAKGIRELLGGDSFGEIDSAFGVLFLRMAKNKIISEQVYLNTAEEVFKKMPPGELFEFPEELKPSADTTKNIAEAIDRYNAFIKKYI